MAIAFAKIPSSTLSIKAPTPTPARCLDLGFRYTCATETNVQDTWIKHGWVPPDRERQNFLATYINHWTV